MGTESIAIWSWRAMPLRAKGIAMKTKTEATVNKST
jgi:hypothetical protein